MNDKADSESETHAAQENGPIPFGQRLFDRPIVLLVLGVAVMFVFYTIWGMFEILSLPKATLP